MSTPPQGEWPPRQPPGQPYGQPVDPSGYNPQQQPPPPGWQEGAWVPHPGPPPQRGNGLKWLLIGVAVLLVIGITIGATLLFTRGGSGGGGTTTPSSGAPSDIASANDTGPVAIITDEPTCQTFNSINDTLADVQKNGWASERALLGSSTDWTADQRSHVETVGKSMRNAADEAVRLAKQTPHRVVRELYAQFIASGRAYADKISSYQPKDDGLADVFVDAGTTMIGICNSIELGSANRTVTLDSASPPTRIAAISDPAASALFLTDKSSTCDRWVERLGQFNLDTNEWQKLDPSIPGSQWTPEQKSVVETTLPLLNSFASDMNTMGRESNNPVLEDFAQMGSLYFAAFVSAGANYVVADSWLYYTGVQIANLISGACKAEAD